MKKIGKTRRVGIALAISLLIGVAAVWAAIPSMPYGQYNINRNATTALLRYPDVLKNYFDAKSNGVELNSPTLNRMKAYPNNGAQRTSDVQGEPARATSNEELAAFVGTLSTGYMTQVSLGTFPSYASDGVTVDGAFDLPMLIFSNPPRVDATTLRNLNKPIVYLQGQIHGNEMSATDAVLAIASDLAENRHGILDRVSVIVVPRFNMDGAWKNQRGTDATNPDFSNLDQNRDAVAAISPVTRAVRNMLVTYRPEVFIDFHEMGYETDDSAEYTTGGSSTGGYKFYHAFDLATLVAHPYNVPDAVTTLARDIEETVWNDLASAGLKGYTYLYPADMVSGYSQARREGIEVQNGDAVVSGYATYPKWMMEGPADESISDSAASLAPSVAILFETRAPKILTNFKTRVHAHHTAGISALRYVASRADDFRNAVREGAERITEMGLTPEGSMPITLWTKQKIDYTVDMPVLALNARKTNVQEDSLRLDRIYRNNGQSSHRSVERPYAYVISADAASAAAIASRLALTGVTMSRLTEDQLLQVEAYRVDSIDGANSAALGHTARGNDYFPLSGSTLNYGISNVANSTKSYRFPAGTYIFYMAQPAANLAALAVEPMANRNLGNYWYSLNASGADTSGFLPVAVGAEYPVYRYMTAAELSADVVMLEAPFVQDAFVRANYPFTDATEENGFVFGYRFEAAYPSTGGIPQLFTVTLPTRRNDIDLSYTWHVYNWTSGAYEARYAEATRDARSLLIRSDHIGPTGEVRLAAVKRGNDEDGGGGGSGGGCTSANAYFLIALTLPVVWRARGK